MCRRAIERSECVNARAMLKAELLVSDLVRLDVFCDDSIYVGNQAERVCGFLFSSR